VNWLCEWQQRQPHSRAVAKIVTDVGRFGDVLTSGADADGEEILPRECGPHLLFDN
jgi:hypothetical protein